MSVIWLAYVASGVGVLLEWRSYLLHCGRALRRWSAGGALRVAAMLNLKTIRLLDPSDTSAVRSHN